MAESSTVAPAQSKKIGLFDWIGAVQNTGVDLSQGGDPYLLRGYEPFMVSRGCAQSLDCLMLASEANRRVITDKYMHLKFLMNSIRKRKRMSKWAKKEQPFENEDLELVCTFYEVSKERGANYLTRMSPEQLQELRSVYDPGGNKAAKRGKK